jgi:hypothetical protein
MSDETKNNLPAADGFDDFAGDDQQFARVIQGEKWQFTNEGTWVNGDEEEIPPDREVVVVNTARVLQKWIDQTPVRDATRFLAPGAGDAFVGALVAALDAGAAPIMALRHGVAAGSLACTAHGAQPALPTRSAIDALLPSVTVEGA